MGISTDVNGQLDKFAQLDAFFDAVKNPDKYLTLIAEAKSTLSKIQDLVGPATTIEKAGDVMNKAQQFKAEASEQVNKMYDDLEAEQKEWLSDKQKRDEALASDRSQLQRDIEIWKKQKDEADANDLRLKDILTSLTDKEKTLYEKEFNLNLKEQDLQDKSNKLKQLLG